MTMNRFLAALFFGLIVLGLIFALFWALRRNNSLVVSALLLLLIAVVLVWLEVHDRLGRQIRRKRAGPPPLEQPLLIRGRPSVPGSLPSDLGQLRSDKSDAAVFSHHHAGSMCDPCSPVTQDTSVPECSSSPNDSGSS